MHECDKGHLEAAREIAESLPQVQWGRRSGQIDVSPEQFVDILADAMCRYHEAGRHEALQEVDVWLPAVLSVASQPA
jgi:hypothetical protein